MPFITENKLDFTKLLTTEQVKELITRLSIKTQQILELDPELFEPFAIKSTLKEYIVLYPLAILCSKIADSELSQKEAETLLTIGLEDISVYALNNINLYLLAGVDVETPVKEVQKLKVDQKHLNHLRQQLEQTLAKIKEVYSTVPKTEAEPTTPVETVIKEDKLSEEDDPWIDAFNQSAKRLGFR